ncbi:conserved Plasmodium protein, unknown function [Plasmodium relictum]|uniref:Uncharacterized protein n=1 Tax=Plasmodium relictum TaxID=85471 RepID=A0A1J1H558_PLARL|nr:conserved Plasmodium protein, unknown function [Plasmodium relictum]CRH00047.1 conserved Plasmodium protein, unknown function [Plasmodium relictum]
MGEAKNKFEITRNRSSTSIKENLLYSSDILKTSSNLLKNSLFEGNDKKNYVNHTFNKEKIINIYDLINTNDTLNENCSINNKDVIYNHSSNNHVLNKEFSNGMFYDKIMMSNKTCNSAVNNLQNNFRGNNLTNVVNSIKFEENANMKIPSILKNSPLYVLYPELNNIREKEGENKEKINDIENFNKNEFLGEVNDKKKLSNYLRDDLINNTLMRNKMYDYFELEKKNLIQIEGPNELSHKLLISKPNEASNVILNCYKNRYVTNNNNHINNELNTLNFLKKQKMPIVEKSERDSSIMHSTTPRKKNLLNKEVNEEEKISTKKEKELLISLIDTSNNTATVKTYDFKNNKEVKDNKNIFQIKKKPLKDVEVQTNEEELKKSTINVIDSDVENVYNILYKKKSDIQSNKAKNIHTSEKDNNNNNEFKNDNNEKIKQELLNDEKEKSGNLKYKISYNMTKQSDKSDVSIDDNCSDSDDDSDSGRNSNDSYSNDLKKNNAYKSEEDDDDKKNKKKLDIKEHIAHYSECMNFGVPYNFVNMINNKSSTFHKTPFIENVVSNDLKVGNMLNMNILNIDKNKKNWNSKEILKKNCFLKKLIPSTSNHSEITCIPHYIPMIQNNMNVHPPENHIDLYHNNLKYAYKNFIFPMNNQLKNTSLNKRFLPLLINKNFPSLLKSRRESRNKKKLYKLDKNFQKIKESEESTISEESKSEDEYEKSKIINNLLLKKLYISKEKELNEKKKFQDTFWSFLQNNDMLKERTRGKFNSLRNICYNDTEKENVLFLNKYRYYKGNYNKNINNMKNYFLDNNQKLYTKGFSNINYYSPIAQSNQIKNKLDPKKRKYSQPTYNENFRNQEKDAQRFVNFNENLNLSSFKEEKNDYLKEKKKKEFENKKALSKIHLNENFVILGNLKSSNKNILNKKKNISFNSHTSHPINKEIYNSSLSNNSEKRLRSFSYKNRLQKLNMLSKSIAPYKAVIKKNENILKEKNKEKYFNINKNDLKTEVENVDNEKRENWELNEQKDSEKGNYQKKLNDIKISYNMKNTLKNNYNSGEKYHITDKMISEKGADCISNKLSNFYNISHKDIVETENFNLRTYGNNLIDTVKLNNLNDNFSYKAVMSKDEDCTIEGGNEKKEKNLKSQILNNNETLNDHLMTYEKKYIYNKTDNLLRIKVNLKGTNEKTIIPSFNKDENKKIDNFDHFTFQDLNKNHENLGKNEKSAGEAISNQKSISILDETKGNFSNTEMNEIKTSENKINDIIRKSKDKKINEQFYYMKMYNKIYGFLNIKRIRFFFFFFYISKLKNIIYFNL